MNEYPEGELVKLIGTYTDINGAYQDPSSVKLTIQDPDGVKTTYTYGVDVSVVKTSTGIYYRLVDTTGQPGVWLYRWWATGTGQTATTDDAFHVLGAVPS